jgi:hypothetical protein
MNHQHFYVIIFVLIGSLAAPVRNAANASFSDTPSISNKMAPPPTLDTQFKHKVGGGAILFEIDGVSEKLEQSILFAYIELFL